MGSKNKHNKSDLPDFIRYTGNRMTQKERNAFERELQKDPFTAEAAEGFEEISPEGVREDINILRQKLSHRTRKTYNRRFYYRVAASVALLALLGTVTVLILRNQDYRGQEFQKLAEQEFEIPERQPIMQEEKRYEKTGADDRQIAERTAIAEIPEKETSSNKKEKISEDEIMARKAATDISTEKAGAEIPEAIAGIEKPSENVMVPAMARAAVRSAGEVRGIIISAEDNLPLPGAIVRLKGSTVGTVTDTGGNFILNLPEPGKGILQASYIGMETKDFQANTDSAIEVRLDPSVSALNEVVVVGYGTSKRSALAGAEKADEARAADEVYEYTPPEPVTGKKDFDKYIEDNLRNPENFKGQRAVVVISLTVMKDGNLDNIRILRSPGEEFSNEAIRLIKDGPGWKPAIENGEPIEDEVRIRIVFR